METFWSVLEKIAIVVTLFGLPYIVARERRRVPRFSFSFSGSGREFFSRDNLDWCRLRFSGTVRNQSLDHNTVERIWLIVWRKGRKGTHRYGHGGLTEINEQGETRRLPLAFAPRQSRGLEVIFEVALTGSSDQRLATQTTEISRNLNLPKYQYELAFEDVLGNLFDQRGVLCNRKGIDLRWTLENTFEKLKDGNPLPFIWHWIQIFATDLIFAGRRLIRRLGM